MALILSNPAVLSILPILFLLIVSPDLCAVYILRGNMCVRMSFGTNSIFCSYVHTL